MFPAFPAHAQPKILRIWQEAHADYDCYQFKHPTAYIKQNIFIHGSILRIQVIIGITHGEVLSCDPSVAGKQIQLDINNINLAIVFLGRDINVSKMLSRTFF